MKSSYDIMKSHNKQNKAQRNNDGLVIVFFRGIYNQAQTISAFSSIQKAGLNLKIILNKNLIKVTFYKKIWLARKYSGFVRNRKGQKSICKSDKLKFIINTVTERGCTKDHSPARIQRICAFSDNLCQSKF